MDYNKLRVALDSLRKNDENTLKIYYLIREIFNLHKPIETYNVNNVHKAWLTCTHCNNDSYPCQTIELIEKELRG